MAKKYKYGRPKKRNLDQQKIKAFLQELDFKVDSISQPWRHLVAFGTYQGKSAVFKLASTQTTSKKTRQEYRWNQLIHWLPPEQKTAFTVPRNYAQGEYQKLFYIIMQCFPTSPLAQKNQDLSSQNIPVRQIAQIAYQIINIKLPEDKIDDFKKLKPDYDKQRGPIGEKLLESTTEWANQVPRNLDSYLQVIKDSISSLKRAPAHGDFVLRQLYQLDGKLGLIDGEHAGLFGPRYYDVAQFYLRTYRDHNAQDQAQKFLIEFKSLLSKDNQATFWQQLKPVLIQRYIGDLWGAKNDEEHLDDLKSLGEKILQDKIISLG